MGSPPGGTLPGGGRLPAFLETHHHPDLGADNFGFAVSTGLQLAHVLRF
jgi:hypothetical protein